MASLDLTISKYTNKIKIKQFSIQTFQTMSRLKSLNYGKKLKVTVVQYLSKTFCLLLLVIQFIECNMVFFSNWNKVDV